MHSRQQWVLPAQLIEYPMAASNLGLLALAYSAALTHKPETTFNTKDIR